jgi:hypothetical protein
MQFPPKQTEQTPTIEPSAFLYNFLFHTYIIFIFLWYFVLRPAAAQCSLAVRALAPKQVLSPVKTSGEE